MALSLILLWGIAVRGFIWFHRGGLYSKEGLVDVDDYLAVSQWLWSGQVSEMPLRPTQLLYPLLLSPIHRFGISAQLYVLFLHTTAAAVMIVCSYKIGERLAGHRYGLLVALLVASYHPSFMFFNWMLTDTVYYAALTAFVLLALWCWERRRTWPLVAAGTFLFLIKPESIAPIAVATAYGRKPRAIAGAALAVLVCAALLFSWRPTRMALLSHVHVAHGLWLSTHTLVNAGGDEQYDAYVEVLTLGAYRGYTGNAALSVKSLEMIQEHPVRYVLRIPVRWIAVWYPGLFRVRASALWRLKDLSLSVFATLGALLCVFLQTGARRGIAAIGLAMTLVVACYVSDGDLRFRIPILLVFLLVAPLGWHTLYQRLMLDEPMHHSPA